VIEYIILFDVLTKWENKSALNNKISGVEICKCNPVIEYIILFDVLTKWENKSALNNKISGVEISKCNPVIPKKNLTATISVRKIFFGIFETQYQNSVSSPKIVKNNALNFKQH
jgi:hypothetical protein